MPGVDGNRAIITETSDKTEPTKKEGSEPTGRKLTSKDNCSPEHFEAEIASLIYSLAGSTKPDESIDDTLRKIILRSGSYNWLIGYVLLNRKANPEILKRFGFTEQWGEEQKRFMESWRKLSEMYEKEGQQAYFLADGANSIGEIRTKLKLSEDRILEIYAYLSQNQLIKIRYPKGRETLMLGTPIPNPPMNFIAETQEKVIQIIIDQYGSAGLRIYNLINGERTAEEILHGTGISEKKFVEMLDFFDEQGIIALNYPRGTGPSKIQQAAQRSPFIEEGDPDLQKGVHLYHVRTYVDAITEFTKTIKTGEKSVCYLNRGAALHQSMDFKNAIEDFNKAIELDRTDFRGVYNRALSYERIQQHKKAIDDFTTVLNLKGDFADAYYLRGQAYGELNDHAEAIKNYEKAIKLKPNLMNVSWQLASTKHKLNSVKLATMKAPAVPAAAIPMHSCINLSDVGGLKSLKMGKIREILTLLKSPEAAREYGVDFGGGVLFFGPPGCGKSFVTEAIAGEANVTFLKASIADTLNMYVGNSEKNIRQIFEAARKKQPAIIFFDEMEALGASREGASANWERMLVNQFLTEMDQIEKKGERILVIGATNSPWHIDHALKRSGRFSETIFIGPPERDERAEIFRIHCRKITLLDKIDYTKLATLSEGFSGADIQTVCKETSKRVWLEGRKRKIKTADFIQTIKNCKGRFNTLSEWFEIAKKNGIAHDGAKPIKIDEKNMFG